MMEMKIKIEVPDLTAAITKLAAALTPPDPSILTPDEARPGIPAPAVPPMAPAVAPPTAPAAPAPTIPVSEAPAYTLDQISHAGAALVDAGKMEPLLALLSKYGVAAVTQIPQEQYGAFATELRALGAKI